MRQYGRVQNVLKPPTDLAPLEAEEKAQAFRDWYSMIERMNVVNECSGSR